MQRAIEYVERHPLDLTLCRAGLHRGSLNLSAAKNDYGHGSVCRQPQLLQYLC